MLEKPEEKLDERRGALASKREEEKARGDGIGLKTGVRRVGLRNKTAIVHDVQNGRMLSNLHDGTRNLSWRCVHSEYV